MIDFALLSTGQLAALLGGAALATVALYLLKPRKRRVVVPFVALWESVLAPKPSAALFSKLRRLISLLVALLIVALLALSRGGPRWSTHAGKHTVILVDAGAHMQARDVAPTRWAVALREARRLVDARGPADELMIAQLDETVTPVSPMTSDARQLEAAVSELQPSHAPTQLRDGLRLALDVLRNRAEPEIVLISDGVADPASELEREASRHGVKLRQIQIGNRSKNLRVSSLAARRYPLDPSQAEIMLEVENGGDAPADAQLTLLSDGRALDSEPLTLQPHERRSRFYEHIGGADASLSARIEPRAGTVDDLPG
ncbi:MAG TPA: VWA domain-containing protein, partial [Polyangiales bacterium]|nr:VWA domain-containing protein [Polyangiales bacterium]